jgi:hypothetical protein
MTRDAAGGPPDLGRFAEVNERYELDTNFESVVELCEAVRPLPSDGSADEGLRRSRAASDRPMRLALEPV